MKFHIKELNITFKKGVEHIPFGDFNYFYGQMGAGKSTIARLIDFCLGGSLSDNEMTPALQCEFVSASLLLEIRDAPLLLRRDIGSNRIRADWVHEGEPVEVMIPARKADGEVIEGSSIEVLSDLTYFMAGRTPPKVRRSKIKEESELGRLSLRDLLWFCYLDQDSMDSSFFHLEREGDRFKRLKSRDVLRFLVGFYQEQVSELEIKLEQHRSERLRCEAGAKAIRDALSEAEIATETELVIMRKGLEEKIVDVERVINESRMEVLSKRPHAMEELQKKARGMSLLIAELEQASSDIRDAISKDKAHKNELLMLSTRFRRSQSAREVLGGVSFKDCPRCCRALPEHDADACQVCGQVHIKSTAGAEKDSAAEKDLYARVTELTELIVKYETEFRKNERSLRENREIKAILDAELNKVSAEYDSAYLSSALVAEKQRAALQQQLIDLSRIEVLVQKIVDLSDRVTTLIVEEKRIRAELKQARQKAEKDTENLGRLKQLFLDCLLRAKISGFYPDDIVEMIPPFFLPEITSAGSGDLAVTSFKNLGSGGKKTLFKCCFAIAVHRLAVELKALLPSFIIIDSPMKNISERENREQFEGFFKMLYDLSSCELKGTQFVVIDKEECPPPEGYEPSFSERHMKPNERVGDPKDNLYPPLIPYYQGK